MKAALICQFCNHVCIQDTITIADIQVITHTCLNCGLRYPLRSSDDHYNRTETAAIEAAKIIGAKEMPPLPPCPHCKSTLAHLTYFPQAAGTSWWYLLKLQRGDPLRYQYQCPKCGFQTPTNPDWKAVLDFCQHIIPKETSNDKV